MRRGVLLYEGREAAGPMAALYAAGMLLAFAARAGWFSVTDMPLFYLLFVGAAVVLLGRIWRTMFGREASLLFSTPLRAGEHILLQVLLAAGYSVLTTAVIAAAVLCQGEAMSALLRALRPIVRLLLFTETSLSLFCLILHGMAVMALINLPAFRRYRALAAVLWIIALDGGMALLGALTARWVSGYVVISVTGGVAFSGTATEPNSFSVSINEAMWIALVSPLCVWLAARLTRKYLLVE